MLLVLILVLVEDGLGAWVMRMKIQEGLVLILVLVEDGLGDAETNPKGMGDGLNPCSSGRWSRRLQKKGKN